MAATAAAESPARGPMTPVPYRVVSRAPETADTWTLLLEPLGDPVVPAPGQFNMLYAFGVGEVPISTSAAPDAGGALVHTIRDVGAVSHALVGAGAGAVIGVRGPYGTLWPLEEARGRDLVIVAGGIGLAPLRPAIYHALTHRDDFESVCVLVGARTPAELLFVRELEDWRGRFDVDLDVTVDNAARGLARPRRRRHAAHPAGAVRPGDGRRARLRARADDDVHRAGPARPRDAEGEHLHLDGAQHAVRARPLRPLPARAGADLP